METTYRDNAILRNQLILKLLLSWALSSTAIALVLVWLCLYAFGHREIHWLPICTDGELAIGEHSYSPSYLKDMTSKAIDLRLTYSPDTLESRYVILEHLVLPTHQEAFKKQLSAEIETVKAKNISSVFYVEKVAVDSKHHQGHVDGTLYRTSHGLQIKPQQKSYVLQFDFKNGVLWLQSIKEVRDAKN